MEESDMSGRECPQPNSITFMGLGEVRIFEREEKGDGLHGGGERGGVLLLRM